MKKIGFLINPIAGMGGRVGLKGTDDVVDQARALGAKPVSNARAIIMLNCFLRISDEYSGLPAIEWCTPAGEMGAHALSAVGLGIAEIVHTPESIPTREDTRVASRQFLARNLDLVVFCGGDGTARDISSCLKETIPILGIPSGVKMYSGVFGITPEQTAEVLLRFLLGELDLIRADVLDLDEHAYRGDRWRLGLYEPALTPYLPNMTQVAKAIVRVENDESVKREIASVISAHMEKHPEALYLMGPGSTVHTICQTLGIQKSLLGIDAVCSRRLVAGDLNEAQIIKHHSAYPECYIIVSPIGAQGFVLGRGNLQISADVVRKTGVNNLLIVATEAKLATLPYLHFDTGDTDLDAELCATGYREVIVGAGRLRMVACHKPSR